MKHTASRRVQTLAPSASRPWLLGAAPMLLALVSAAQATTVRSPLNVAPLALFQPGAGTLQAACDAGYGLAMSGGTRPDLPGKMPTELRLTADATHAITVQTAAGSALNRCLNTALTPALFPDAAQLQADSLLWVKVSGHTVTPVLSEAQTWTVSLSVQDRAGRELARLQPTIVQAGQHGIWTTDCSDDPCVWQGQNRYAFSLAALPASVMTAVRSGTRLVVDLGLPDLAAQPETTADAEITWLPDQVN